MENYEILLQSVQEIKHSIERIFEKIEELNKNHNNLRNEQTELRTKMNVIWWLFWAILGTIGTGFAGIIFSMVQLTVKMGGG